MHVASAGTKAGREEGYDVPGIFLHDALNLTVELALLLDIDRGINLVQEGVERLVAIVRLGQLARSAVQGLCSWLPESVRSSR